MNRYRRQLEAALRAGAVRGPTQYAWLGNTSRSLPRSIADEMDAPARRRYLQTRLREDLYSSFYIFGTPVPARRGGTAPVAADPGLLAALSQANAGRGTWEDDWRLDRLTGAHALVTRAGIRASVLSADCSATGTLRAGAAVRIRVPKELPTRSPGFFTVLGDAPADRAAWASLVRVYWNITRRGAPALVAALSAQLNGVQIPFRLKVADHPARLTRCDAAVLYLPAVHFGAIRAMLLDVSATLATVMRTGIPAFTLELASGVGLAEECGDQSDSFGERRCGMLADAIVRAHEEGLREIDARLEATVVLFAERGVDIDRPYLESGLAGRHAL